MDLITIAVGAFTALKSGITPEKNSILWVKTRKLWHAIDDVDAEHATQRKEHSEQ